MEPWWRNKQVTERKPLPSVVAVRGREQDSDSLEELIFGKESFMGLYPRRDNYDELVSTTQLVGHNEHLSSVHRMVFLTGEISDKLSFSNRLLALDSLSHEPIKVVITSPGGLLDTALILYDTMRLLQSPVYTIGRWACSAACLLLAAGAKRYLFPHSKVMLHLPFAQMGGDTRQLEIQQKQIMKYKETILDVLQECGVTRTREQILADIDREFWLEPQAAIEYGLADHVVSPGDMKDWLKGENRHELQNGARWGAN